MAKQRDSVVDPDAPKAEQERQVEDEIEKSDEELFGDTRPEPLPDHAGDRDYIRHPDLIPEKRGG